MMQGPTKPPDPSGVDPQTVNIVFFVLFAIYLIQLAVVSRSVTVQWRRRSANPQQGVADPQQNAAMGSIRLWTFLGLSLLGPILLGFLPDLVFDRGGSLSMTLHVGVRFLIAYLVTIVTLELTWLAQDKKSQNSPWKGLLAINLLFDVISAVIFDMYKDGLDHMEAGIAVRAFFLLCAVPTVVTGTVVISGAYSLLDGD